jgi:hypothetical protein
LLGRMGMRGAKQLVVGLAIVGVVVSCSRGEVWHRGDLASAEVLAGKRNTLVMVEFYADW